MFARALLRARPMVMASAACATAALSLQQNSSAEMISFSSATPKVHLMYFKVQGVAETIRHVMALGKIEWTESDWSVDFKKIDFKDVQRTLPLASPEFGAAKEAGELDLNMQRAPIAIVDGIAIASSKTIERYLAKRLGVMGSDDLEAVHIDCITEHVRDIKDKYQKAKADPKEKADFFESVMPGFMQKLETAVVKMSPGSGPALVGSSLSYADVTLLVFIKDFFDDKASAVASISKCPRLQASVEAAEKHPGIAKHRAGRK